MRRRESQLERRESAKAFAQLGREFLVDGVIFSRTGLDGHFKPASSHCSCFEANVFSVDLDHKALIKARNQVPGRNIPCI